MKIAVIGGGINGLASAWKLALDGHQVTLFERDELMRATSQASSKLLHGGLRYLENGEIGLVREALAERTRWFKRAPHLARPLPMLYPIFKTGRRSRWMIAAGLWLYRLLSLSANMPAPRWLSKDEVVNLQPNLKADGLTGGYLFHDGQMDDYPLGMWVAEQCRSAGVEIFVNTPVQKIRTDGSLKTQDGQNFQFDWIVNVAGPWAERLLQQSGIKSPVRLDLVRGSHLIVNRCCDHAYLLEVPDERRIFFVLPWKSKTLIGTTEIRQEFDEPVICSREEISYLLKSYNHWMEIPLSEQDVIETFAGVRPLLSSADDPSRVTREYAIRRDGMIVNVFGGKWTTCCALADKVAVVLN
ncbi:MAG: glycerol-3-phosphate dehydrogenase/oxidase [Gallionella sp.]|jgi:glycerol-3-phosphate dehydrogenase